MVGAFLKDLIGKNVTVQFKDGDRWFARIDGVDFYLRFIRLTRLDPCTLKSSRKSSWISVNYIIQIVHEEA
jgi:hypothetical protein